MSAAATYDFSLSLDNETGQRFCNLLNQRRCTPDTVMMEALGQYLDRAQARQQYVQNGLEALALYQSDGLHLTQEEMDDWLSKLEAGEESEPPACHV